MNTAISKDTNLALSSSSSSRKRNNTHRKPAKNKKKKKSLSSESDLPLPQESTVIDLPADSSALTLSSNQTDSGDTSSSLPNEKTFLVPPQIFHSSEFQRYISDKIPKNYPPEAYLSPHAKTFYSNVSARSLSLPSTFSFHSYRSISNLKLSSNVDSFIRSISCLNSSTQFNPFLNEPLLSKNLGSINDISTSTSAFSNSISEFAFTKNEMNETSFTSEVSNSSFINSLESSSNSVPLVNSDSEDLTPHGFESPPKPLPNDKDQDIESEGLSERLPFQSIPGSPNLPSDFNSTLLTNVTLSSEKKHNNYDADNSSPGPITERIYSESSESILLQTDGSNTSISLDFQKISDTSSQLPLSLDSCASFDKDIDFSTNEVSFSSECVSENEIIQDSLEMDEKSLTSLRSFTSSSSINSNETSDFSIVSERHIDSSSLKSLEEFDDQHEHDTQEESTFQLYEKTKNESVDDASFHLYTSHYHSEWDSDIIILSSDTASSPDPSTEFSSRSTTLSLLSNANEQVSSYVASESNEKLGSSTSLFSSKNANGNGFLFPLVSNLLSRMSSLTEK